MDKFLSCNLDCSNRPGALLPGSVKLYLCILLAVFLIFPRPCYFISNIDGEVLP